MISDSCMANLQYYDITAMHQMWKKGSFYSYETSGRPVFGICFLSSGTAVYKTKDSIFTANAGDIVVLKRGAHYRAEFLKVAAENILINFCCDGEFLDDDIIIRKNCGFLSEDFSGLLTYITLGQLCMAKSVFYRILGTVANFENDNTLPARVRCEILADRNFLLNENELAKKCYISVSTMQRAFKSAYGETVISYRRRIRTERAKQLLFSGEYTVEQVASALNFCDSAYFCKCFKKETGKSPTAFIRSFCRM